MSKQLLDKKFYIILSVVVFFGLSGLSLAGWYVWDQRHATETTSQGTPRLSEEESYWAEHADEQNQMLYDQCISIANEYYNKALTQIPSDMTPEQKLLSAQMLAQTKDSSKADCDREYKD